MSDGGNGKADEGEKTDRIRVIDPEREAKARSVREELERMVASQQESPFQIQSAKFKGQFANAEDGPVWALGLTIPEGMWGRPIRILCATRSGVFTVFGEIRKGGPDAEAAERARREKDSERLDMVQARSWDLRCFDQPTGQGDADIGWSVIEHHMGAPTERVKATVFRDDVRAAIDAAIDADE